MESKLELLAKEIAAKVFDIGEELGVRPNRVSYKIGNPDDEQDAGGLCEGSLANVVRTALVNSDSAALRSPQPVPLPTHEGWWWEWDEQQGEWFEPQEVSWRDGKPWIETSSQDYECQPGNWLPVLMPPPLDGKGGG